MRSDNEAENVMSGVLSLDEDADSATLAERTHYSIAQYYRLVKKHSADPPMAARRRLLLERAAYLLTRTRTSISEIALDAGFESLEGFGRGFKRAYRVTPRDFRKLNPSEYRIDATERIHYAPPISPVGPPRQGEISMKLIERLFEHHRWTMHKVIDHLSQLTPQQLDEETGLKSPFPWCDTPETIRTLIHENISFAEPWLDAINGQKLTYDKTTPEGLKQGLDQNTDEILKLIATVEAEGRWDMTFVDSLCDPPEVFSYVGVIGHLVTFNAYRRVLMIQLLRQHGIDDLGFGDTIEYDPDRR